MPGVFLRRRFLTRKALEFSIVFIRIVYELAPVIVETAAFKASRSLASRLLVSESECDLVKAVFSLFCRENAHPFARDMFSVRKVALVYFALDKYRFFVADNIAAKITVNNRYALLRFTYSGYGYVCALVCGVADCKNAVYIRSECALVCAYRAARGLVKLFKSAELRPLTDSHYYTVNFKSFEFSLYRNRLSSAARVGFAELHYLKFYSADFAVLR